jgi:hypothetical protein
VVASGFQPPSLRVQRAEPALTLSKQVVGTAFAKLVSSELELRLECLCLYRKAALPGDEKSHHRQTTVMTGETVRSFINADGSAALDQMKRTGDSFTKGRLICRMARHCH